MNLKPRKPKLRVQLVLIFDRKRIVLDLLKLFEWTLLTASLAIHSLGIWLHFHR